MRVTTSVSDGVNPTEVQTMNQTDPFQYLAEAARANGRSVAQVRVNFGDTVECLDPTGRKRWVKCDVSLQVECPQEGNFIDYAQNLLRQYAIRFSNAALSRAIPDYVMVPEG